MPDVDDVAAAIIAEYQRQYPGEPITTWKLQKLVYYAQAWYLADTGSTLFDDPIEAWKDGPVVRSLFEQHQGMRHVSAWCGGNSALIGGEAANVIARVVSLYGFFEPETLKEMTHRDLPWRRTREGLPQDDHSSRPIDPGLIAEFYSRQRSSPDAALSFALASTRLEGCTLSADAEMAVRDVAYGRVSVDEAIERRLTMLGR